MKKNIQLIIILTLLFNQIVICQVQDTSKGIYRDMELANHNKNNVKALLLNNQGLKEFPISVLEFKNLEVLNLMDNELTEIPLDIDKLIKLRRLFIANNPLEKLPYSISHLYNLQVVFITTNKSIEKDIEYIIHHLQNCIFFIYEVQEDGKVMQSVKGKNN